MSTKLDDVKMKDGYYWIKHEGIWEIGDFECGSFYLSGRKGEIDYWDDKLTDVIYEPILRPKA